MSVPSSDKPLHGMFTAVPPRYDFINSVITWGLDRRWRNAAAKICLDDSPGNVLDLGCGTGDLAVAVARFSNGAVEIVGLDYSQPMLEIALEKAERHYARGISFIDGDVSNLPFKEGCFDCTGISFAFRNLTYRNPISQRALAETARVLRPGGRFVIVETSQPESPMIRGLFHLYLRWFVKGVGRVLSGNAPAYHYLAESAARFYTPGEVKRLLLDAGFREVSYRPLFFGAAGIHVAVK